MKIDHIAIWADDIELLRKFYMRFHEYSIFPSSVRPQLWHDSMQLQKEILSGYSVTYFMQTTDIQKNQKYRIALFIVDALDLEDNGAGAVVAAGDHCVLVAHPALHTAAGIRDTAWCQAPLLLLYVSLSLSVYGIVVDSFLHFKPCGAAG